MAELDINATVILIVLFIIYGVFLCYDLFRKGEKYGYLAYILAVIPVNYLWFLGFDVLGVYTTLFILWIICLLRDLIFVYRKTKEYDDILLFLALGILVQLVLVAIIPADQLNPQLQAHTFQLWVFYFPDIYTDTFGIEPWVNANSLLGFRASATILVILALLPMILDLKDAEEQVPLPVVIVVTLIFVPFFMYLSYIWLPVSIFVLTLLFSVILFIVLLLLTKPKKE